MRAIPHGKAEQEADVPKRHNFLHRLAAAVDVLAAFPVGHALSERDRRQVDEEIERCRELMRRQRPRRHDATIVSFPAAARQVFAPVKVRR